VLTNGGNDPERPWPDRGAGKSAGQHRGRRARDTALRCHTSLGAPRLEGGQRAGPRDSRRSRGQPG